MIMHRRAPRTSPISQPNGGHIPADIDTTRAVLRALRNVQPIRARPLPWRCTVCGRRNHPAFNHCPHCTAPRRPPDVEGAGE
jgi:hypothetical protein